MIKALEKLQYEIVVSSFGKTANNVFFLSKRFYATLQPNWKKWVIGTPKKT